MILKLPAACIYYDFCQCWDDGVTRHVKECEGQNGVMRDSIEEILCMR